MNDNPITREERIEWMAVWCAKNNLKLNLEGVCGFARECVGITADGNYPDYEWYDKKTYERIDNNGEVWIPADAYNKHPCVAVLGRGEWAEKQLYKWLRWFDENGFKLEEGIQDVDPKIATIQILLGQHRFARMARQEASPVSVPNDSNTVNPYPQNEH